MLISYSRNRGIMRYIISLFFIFFPAVLFAVNFVDVVKQIKQHDEVIAIKQQEQSMKHLALSKGSWGDPKLKLNFKNFPIDSLSSHRTPMTGVELAVVQKVQLTSKYSHRAAVFQEMSQVSKLKAEDKQQQLLVNLWKRLTEKRMITAKMAIIQEGISWISQMLTVSKSRYALGKLSQQALLDIKIRKVELGTKLDNMVFKLKELDHQLSYISPRAEHILLLSVPWKVLDGEIRSRANFKEQVLLKKISAAKHRLQSAKLAYVPDLTVQFGYTKRDSLDEQGDFVSASISFPMPFSNTSVANHSVAIHQQLKVKYQKDSFDRMQLRERNILKIKLQKIKSELNTLDGQTTVYAKDSRKIVAKSYALGEASYLDLLGVELQLQNIRLKKLFLTAELTLLKIDLRYLLGGSLDE